MAGRAPVRVRALRLASRALPSLAPTSRALRSVARASRALWSVALATVGLVGAFGCSRSKGTDEHPPEAGAESSAAVDSGRDIPGRDAAGREGPGRDSLERSKIASRAMETWVQERPDPQSPKLGYLRAGAIVETRGKPIAGAGCAGGWAPIEPRGYVCLGPTATTNLQDPFVTASTRRPALEAGLPYGYAVVRNQGAPFYTRIPTEAEAREQESDWDNHFRTLERAEADEAREGGYPQLSSMPNGHLPIEPAPGVLAPWATDEKDDDLPDFLRQGGHVPNLSGLAWSQRAAYDGGTTCPPGDKACVPLDATRPRKRLGISFVRTFAEGGRRYLLTPDLLLMPADRTRLVRGTSFHGVEIGGTGDGALRLPIVFVTKDGARRFRLERQHLVAGEPLPFRGALNAATKLRTIDGKKYDELADGSYVADSDVVRLNPIRKLPKWGKQGERWLEVNLAKQTLLAVDGDKPVYATLVSTGAGGVADPETNPYVTPRGIFRVHTKHVASTMDSNQPEAEFELRDVPWIQYFKDGYALHAAYWHDQFGLPRSHGCINLAPIDAEHLFMFTRPELPEGWHGVSQALTGTIVWIHL